MTDRYALFGNPLGQSRSPEIQMAFARQTGQDMSYEKIEAPLGGFKSALQDFAVQGGKGCNVTAPFKVEAVGLATRLTDTARVAGAANTLRFDGDDIVAHNTDGIGLVTDIERNCGVALKGKRVLILGAGGATCGAILPLLRAAPREVAVLNRTPSKAAELRLRIDGHPDFVVIDQAPRGGYDIVINATSASLTGACPFLPDGAFDGCELAYELAYGKGETAFLRAARAARVPVVKDGFGMLIEQAACAFEFWRGVKPETTGLLMAASV